LIRTWVDLLAVMSQADHDDAGGKGPTHQLNGHFGDPPPGRETFSLGVECGTEQSAVELRQSACSRHAFQELKATSNIMLANPLPIPGMPELELTTAKSRASRSSERLPATVNVSKILVPIDFTRRSEQTIAYGLQLARFWTAKIFFLHVLPGVDEFASLPFYREIYSRFESAEQKQFAAREKAWNELAKLKRQAAALELNGQGTLREGIPQEEVIRVAANVKPDLIVLGSHGYKRLRRLLLGSTAEHVVRHASCPVLIVRSASANPPYGAP
jgi:universal stress protein A